MRFQLLTLFPEMIEQATSYGVVGQALKQGRIEITALSPRKFTTNVHQTIDDRPFGGGDGMIMMAEPAALALQAMREGREGRTRVVHLSPRGLPLTDAKARELSQLEVLILISSRYGGMDERFLATHVDEEISIGDYVLSGGELAALVIIDSVARLLPGVLGNEASPQDESFGGDQGWLEHPQFTRPREWQGRQVPAALLSGDHAKIAKWKEALSLFLTIERRPDLVKTVSSATLKSARKFLSEMSEQELRECGLREPAALYAKLEPFEK